MAITIGLLLAASAAFGQPSALIANGPYLQDVTENGFTVVWTSSMESVGWVEVAPDDGTNFYTVERPKYYDSKIGKMHIGQLHRVRVEGLQCGTTYRYRILQKGVLINEGDRRVVFSETKGSDVYRRKPLRVTTLDPTKESTQFWVVNDIHARDSIFRKHMEGIDAAKTDFVIFNGDMVSSMESEQQIFAGYLQATSDILTTAGIEAFAVRGNHETRGALAESYLEYFPTRTGEAYYTFRQGPAYFIMMDCGEDKPESDLEYYGLTCTDPYREQEAQWLQGVVESAEYKAAPIHIVILHMPPAAADGWHGQQEISRLFVPILNKADVDIEISGHTHVYSWVEAGELGTNFPILINSNNDKLVVDVDAKGIEIDIVNPDGQTVRHHSVRK